MWEARAKYGDGTTVRRYFDSDPYKIEYDEQYEIEMWLIDRHPDCIWYSVTWIDDIEEY